MSLAIIDAREWQRVFDLKTGAPAQDDGPLVRMVRGALAGHPYPGDLRPEGVEWVTDTALRLFEAYRPNLVFLSYAQLYFLGRYQKVAAGDWQDMVDRVFAEVQRFLEASDCEPIIVGTGALTPIRGTIDLTHLEGLAIASHWSARYAGLHGPSPADLSYVRDLGGIEQVVTREEFLALFPGEPEEASRVPDYLLAAREGYLFKTVGTPLRQSVQIPAHSFEVPVHAPLGRPEHIMDISRLARYGLEDRRVAVIVIEGVGAADFRLPGVPCRNSQGWFYYEPSETQYLTMTTGRHQVLTFPPGYRWYTEAGEDEPYPFSSYFNAVPEGTLGERVRDRSLAVGNRSIFMHMVTGADICVECFARNLYNQGTMAVIHRQEKV